MIIINQIERALKTLDMPEILAYDDVQVKRIDSFSENPTNLQLKLTYKGESYIYEIMAPGDTAVII